jgi:tetratricopeptide (TPR) repeat protein/S1-C subfamily serine protease
MKKILIATLTPLLLTVPLMTISPSFAEKSGGIIAQADSSIRQMAQSFTVKILVGDTNGSGVIIGKTGNTYRVVTNAHVVNRANSYRLQTPDGKVYQGKLIQKGASIEGNDLAILEFQAPVNYSVATLADGGTLKPNDAVYSAGFPIDQSNFMITSGTVTEVTSQPLKGGYQLGFSADTLQGMSGGPLLNASGQLIGIVGMGKGAALTEAYTYQDESRPAKDVINQWRGMSFAVPVATINQIVGDVAKVPSGESQAVPKAKNYTGIVKKVDDIAQQITVRIDSKYSGNGSGVIIGKQGNTYYVLTAGHVVDRNQDSSHSGCDFKTNNGELEAYIIVTSDEQQYNVKLENSTCFDGVDIAVVSFESKQNYTLATLGGYDLFQSVQSHSSSIFLSGFPEKTKEVSKRLLSTGYYLAKDLAEEASKDRLSLEFGNALLYTNVSHPGMSGGPLLDSLGNVIGINTASEDEIAVQKDGQIVSISLGYSLGVPIQTFMGLVSKTDIKTNDLKITNSKPPELTEEQKSTVYKQLGIEAIEIPDQRADAFAWLNYGNRLWRFDKYEEAVKAFDRAILLQPDFYLAYYARGLVKNSGLIDSASSSLDDFEQAIKLNPRFYQAWFHKANDLVYVRRNSVFDIPLLEALAAIDKAIEIEPKEAKLYGLKSYILSFMGGRLQEQIIAYSEAIKIKPNSHRYSELGSIYFRLGDYVNAIDNYSKAISIEPEIGQLSSRYMTRGEAYFKLQDYSKAFADYSKAIELTPNDLFHLTQRANAYLQIGDSSKAIADYTSAIKLAPDPIPVQSEFETTLETWAKPSFYIQRAKAYFALGDFSKAIADYNSAINLEPKKAIRYLDRANIYMQIEDYPKAFADYSKAIELVGSDFKPNYYAIRAEAYLKIQDYPKALSDYTKAIELAPNEFGYDGKAYHYTERANVYLLISNYAQAISDYSSAIKLDTENATLYRGRADIYFQIQDYQNALQDYTKAISVNPNEFDSRYSYYQRGNLYHFLGEYNKAIIDYSKAIAIDRDFVPGIVKIGLLKYEIGVNSEAIQQFQKAISLDQQLAEPQLALATILYKQGEVEKAKQLAQSAFKLDPNFADSTYLKENFWGDKLINDTQQMLKALKL